MEVLDVFLDTEVFRQDPLRRSGPFRALTNLASMGVLRLHVSEVSLREFMTAEEIKVREASEKAKIGLRESPGEEGSETEEPPED